MERRTCLSVPGTVCSGQHICLSYCCISVIVIVVQIPRPRQCTKGEVYWDLQFQKFRVHDCHSWECDSRQAGKHITAVIMEILHPYPQAQSRGVGRAKLGRAWAFETSKPASSDTSPLIRPHPSSFPHSSTTQGPSIQIYENHLHSHHHRWS